MLPSHLPLQRYLIECCRCFLFASCLALSSLYAQEPFYEQLRQSDGLPSNGFNLHLLQDARGYIWGTSHGGPYQYDGERFSKFGPEQGLAERFAVRVSEDPNGKIWIQGYYKDLFRVEADTVIPYVYSDSVSPLIRRDATWGFQVDIHGHLFMGHRNKGLLKMDTTGQLTHIVEQGHGRSGIGVWTPGHLPPIVFGLGDTATNRLGRMLYLFDSLGMETARYQLKEDDFVSSSRSFMTVCEDGSMIVTLDRDMYRVSAQEIMGHARDSGLVNGVVEDEFGNIWAATSSSGMVCYPDGDLNGTGSYSVMSDYLFHSVLQDHEGGLWCGSNASGVFYMPAPQIQVLNASNSDLRYDNLWELSTSTDAFYLQAKTKKVLKIVEGDVQVFDLTELLKDEKLHDLGGIHWSEADQKLYTWCGGALAQIDADGLLSNRSLAARDGFQMSRIGAAATGGDGRYTWFTGHGCVAKLESDSVNYIVKAFPETFIGAAEGEDGRLWLGGLSGVWCWDGDTIQKAAGDEDILHSRVFELLHHNSKLWIASAEQGLGVMDEDSLIIFSEKVGKLITPHGFVPEEDTVWVLSSEHLVKLVMYAKDSIVQYKSRIIYDMNCTPMDMEIVGDEFLVTTVCGLIRFPRSASRSRTVSLPVHTTGVRINDRDTALLAHYELRHDQNRIEIDYTGISYRSGRVSYRYRLQGQDDRWRTTDLPSIQYTELSPGEYTFEVMAEAEEGFASVESASFSFRIAPPVWATWWFRLAVAGVFLLLLWFGIQFRIQSATRKLQTERQMMGLELKALRSQMNPHFAFNTINSILHYISNEQPQTARNYLTQFARLMRMILDHSDREYVRLDQELLSLEHYLELEEMRFEGRFTHEIIVAPEVDPHYVKVPPMLIQPYVENAVLHGLMHKEGKGRLVVKIERSGQDLTCTVEDNGVGRAFSARLHRSRLGTHDSKGMQITRDRLTLLNGRLNQVDHFSVTDLMDEQGEAAGTRVLFSLPSL